MAKNAIADDGIGEGAFASIVGGQSRAESLGGGMASQHGGDRAAKRRTRARGDSRRESVSRLRSPAVVDVATLLAACSWLQTRAISVADAARAVSFAAVTVIRRARFCRRTPASRRAGAARRRRARSSSSRDQNACRERRRGHATNAGGGRETLPLA